jgi:phosphatidylglycerol:prolipoprotein diacylglycerol transferase
VSGFITPYAAALLSGIALAMLAVHRLAGRFGLPRGDLWALSGLLLAAAFIGGHLFDVIFYQWDDAAKHPEIWFAMGRGHSFFGALLAMAMTFVTWTRARQLDIAVCADIYAAGLIVAMMLGRIGCALVHDHPGVPTELPFGIVFTQAQMGSSDEPVVRRHDLGLEELVLLVPIAIATWVLVYRRLRAGAAAAFAGLAYACVRFGLDFLRLPSAEPRYAGMTVGQWCCVVLLLASAARHVARHGRVALLAGESPPPELPTATVKT